MNHTSKYFLLCMMSSFSLSVLGAENPINPKFLKIVTKGRAILSTPAGDVRVALNNPDAAAFTISPNGQSRNFSYPDDNWKPIDHERNPYYYIFDDNGNMRVGTVFNYDANKVDRIKYKPNPFDAAYIATLTRQDETPSSSSSSSSTTGTSSTLGAGVTYPTFDPNTIRDIIAKNNPQQLKIFLDSNPTIFKQYQGGTGMHAGITILQKPNVLGKPDLVKIILDSPYATAQFINDTGHSRDNFYKGKTALQIAKGYGPGEYAGSAKLIEEALARLASASSSSTTAPSTAPRAVPAPTDSSSERKTYRAQLTRLENIINNQDASALSEDPAILGMLKIGTLTLNDQLPKSGDTVGTLAEAYKGNSPQGKTVYDLIMDAVRSNVLTELYNAVMRQYSFPSLSAQAYLEPLLAWIRDGRITLDTDNKFLRTAIENTGGPISDAIRRAAEEYAQGERKTEVISSSSQPKRYLSDAEMAQAIATHPPDLLSALLMSSTPITAAQVEKLLKEGAQVYGFHIDRAREKLKAAQTKAAKNKPAIAELEKIISLFENRPTF